MKKRSGWRYRVPRCWCGREGVVLAAGGIRLCQAHANAMREPALPADENQDSPGQSPPATITNAWLAQASDEQILAAIGDSYGYKMFAPGSRLWYVLQRYQENKTIHGESHATTQTTHP